MDFPEESFPCGEGSGICPDDFYAACDGVVEFVQVFGRNPVFSMDSASDNMDIVSRQENCVYFKFCDISCTVALRIPLACNLNSIFFAAYWIENRLSGKSWREPPHPGRFDEIEFRLPYRAEERGCGRHHSISDHSISTSFLRRAVTIPKSSESSRYHALDPEEYSLFMCRTCLLS